MGVVIGRVDSQVEKIFLGKNLTRSTKNYDKINNVETGEGAEYDEAGHEMVSEEEKRKLLKAQKKKEEEDIILL